MDADSINPNHSFLINKRHSNLHPAGNNDRLRWPRVLWYMRTELPYLRLLLLMGGSRVIPRP